MPDSALLDAALRYARLGWRVLPLKPRGKAPLTRHGVHDATTDPDVIRRWWAAAPEANIGVAMGASGLLAVDVDVRSGGAETFERLVLEHGSPQTVTSLSGRGDGGGHFLLQDPKTPTVASLGRGVDIKSGNGYVVVPPSIHPDTGQPYTWITSPFEHPVAPVSPAWRAALERAARAQPVPDVDRPALTDAARDELKHALTHVPASDYATWVNVGMALHHTHDPHAFDLWNEWSATDPKYPGADPVEAKWASFGAASTASPLTLSYIFKLAKQGGYKEPHPFDVVQDDEPFTEREQGPRSQRLFTYTQLVQAVGEMTWLVKHALPANSLALVFGRSQTFKSFIALDAALHIAHGMPWLGKRTAQGPVVYLAAEGGLGLTKRIQAWHKLNRRTPPEDFVVCPIPFDLQSDARQLAEDIAATLTAAPRLIVVDTMSQLFSGEENSSTDTAAFFRTLGAHLRARFQACVLVIHHSGHTAEDRARGSSAIGANTDVVFLCERGEGEMAATLTNQKQKDGELLGLQSFKLTSVLLGKDSDGDPITSLVASSTTAGEVLAALPPTGRRALFLQACAEGATRPEAQAAFYRELPEDLNAEAKRGAWKREMAWATGSGLLQLVDNTIVRTALLPQFGASAAAATRTTDRTDAPDASGRPVGRPEGELNKIKDLGPDADPASGL